MSMRAAALSGLVMLAGWFATRRAPVSQVQTAPAPGPVLVGFDPGAFEPVRLEWPDLPSLAAVFTWPEPDTPTPDNSGTPPGWTPPERARPYLPTITETEQRQGIPAGLLARLLYEESRYRPDIIDGSTVSSAGAVGIAQIVPRWHPGVNPLDPPAAIRYAGAYLRQLYDQFGSWSMALAAYNWGPGNLQRNGLQRAPAETRNYVAAITGDVWVV